MFGVCLVIDGVSLWIRSDVLVSPPEALLPGVRDPQTLAVRVENRSLDGRDVFVSVALLA